MLLLRNNSIKLISEKIKHKNLRMIHHTNKDNNSFTIMKNRKNLYRENLKNNFQKALNLQNSNKFNK